MASASCLVAPHPHAFETLLVPRLPRRTIAVAVALGLAVACSGDSDTIFGPPPDGTACTRGTLVVGTLFAGQVDATDCVLWDDYLDYNAPSESWTIHAKANTAYIVRMRPVATTSGGNTFAGTLTLHRRNEAGQSVYATGYFGSFGESNLGGGYSKELVFTAAKDQTLSVRVQANEGAPLGPYTIELVTCPVVTLVAGTTSAPITLGPTCITMSEELPDTRLAFFHFRANAFEDIYLTATRTAGTAEMQFHIGGPDLDLSCDLDGCVGGYSTQSAGPIQLSGIMPLPGTTRRRCINERRAP